MSEVPLYPQGGPRAFHQSQLAPTQLMTPWVVHMWSRNTPECGVNETFVVHLVHQLASEAPEVAVQRDRSMLNRGTLTSSPSRPTTSTPLHPFKRSNCRHSASASVQRASMLSHLND